MNKTKVSLHNKGLFPAFLDYDVTELKCRGMSSKIDLFTYGGLNRVLSALSVEERKFIRTDWLFLRAAGIFEDTGFFVTDFNAAAHDRFAEKVRQAGFEKIYIENSEHIELKELQEALGSIEIVLMEFADDPYSQS